MDWRPPRFLRINELYNVSDGKGSTLTMGDVI